ncbi:MAG: D-glycero-alpha-D-manno-heptose-1,7-bisphosphate 7-phosphatase [Bacteroidota bacterium]|jgi:D-glycero-D-manno-heptose 1,7-bisphosphate phosphatase
MNKAIFLDRDGVINEEVGEYITRVADFKVLPHAVEGIKKFNDAGWQVVIITNQGGIAKGLYTAAELDQMHRLMQQQLAEVTAHVDLIYYCPHHPDFGKCLCRKPDSLMVQKALARLNVSPVHAAFIGDKQRDIESAAGASVKGFLIEPNENWVPLADEIIQKIS